MTRWSVPPHGELRVLEPSDAEAVFDLLSANHDHLAPWFRISQLDSAGDVRSRITKGLELYRSTLAMQLGLWDAGRLVGEIQLHHDPNDRTVSLGYWLDRAHQGRGLMSRACERAIALAFSEWNVHRVELRCAAENLRSRRMAERLGFRHEGVLKEARYLQDRYHDLLIFGLLAAEWSKFGGV